MSWRRRRSGVTHLCGVTHQCGATLRYGAIRPTAETQWWASSKQGEVDDEETGPMFANTVYPMITAFWIFVLWVLWTAAHSLKGIDASTKAIAHSMRTGAEASTIPEMQAWTQSSR